MNMLAADSAGPSADDRYDELLAGVQRRFLALATVGTPLFSVGGRGLYDMFLAALTPELAAENTCGTCRAFMKRYGGLVVVDAKGKATSALWSAKDAPPQYARAVAAIADEVERRPIISVFRSSATNWGFPERGPWTHLAVIPPEHQVHTPSALATTGQYIAAKNADRETVARALAEFPHPVVKKAVALLRSEHLYRSDAILGAGSWLLALHKRIETAGGRGEVAQRRRDNLIWSAAATAPAGYCHVRSGMIGTLLRDLADELPFDSVKARFAEKMHPLQYRRPTAAPTAAMIARAERVIAELRAAGSLERRFAKLADVCPIWSAAKDAPPPGGVFGHLVPAKKRRGTIDLDAEPVVMTWEKFARTVLPDAERIEFAVPRENANYGAMVTAVHPDAPPIVQWDTPRQRNPVTWYVYVNGSPPTQWRLRPGEFREVTAVIPHPATWHVEVDRTAREQAVLFALAGATDTAYTSGAGFFPEFLAADLHEIRKTLEAYAKDAVVAGKDEAEVCGLLVSKADKIGHTFRVTAGGVRVHYTLHRWD
ncbi:MULTISPECIES: hypothetical protein [unclassified Nocardia]|uniref:hypothetical protein n=1 Tax=unclassified Nocardia TaxID=2637762 RepID=UPI001CE3C45D|nr:MULTISPECIES: hypothetical protein [unclassified Nocardia]